MTTAEMTRGMIMYVIFSSSFPRKQAETSKSGKKEIYSIIGVDNLSTMAVVKLKIL